MLTVTPGSRRSSRHLAVVRIGLQGSIITMLSTERVDDYWARDLPVNRGRYNFDTIRYDVYRDATVAREAFRKGLFDLFLETDIRYWHASYDIPAVKEGRLLKDTRIVSRYIGQELALVFNLDREMFRDPRVREALTLAFDFEWQNRVLQHDSQNRALSYFAGSSLAAMGLPTEEEITLLAPWRDQLPGTRIYRTVSVTHVDWSGSTLAGSATSVLPSDRGWLDLREWPTSG